MERNDLMEAVKKINPKILIPVHTKNAEEYKKVHDNVKIVGKGERVEV